MFGVQYRELLGKMHFWIFFLGVNFTFFPMHFSGLSGMPRRIPDFPDGYAIWNLSSSFGSYISAISALLFFFIVYDTLTNGVIINRANVWLFPKEEIARQSKTRAFLLGYEH